MQGWPRAGSELSMLPYYYIATADSSSVTCELPCDRNFDGQSLRIVIMKKALIYFPIVLSLVVLGAHFMRYGNPVGVIGSAVLIALLIVRRPWSARLIQVALVLGALEWVRTLHTLVQVRIVQDQPFIRMVIILGVVAAVTLGSALLFQLPTLKKHYRVKL